MSDRTLRHSPRIVSGEGQASSVVSFNPEKIGKALSETQFLRSWFETDSKLYEKSEKVTAGRFFGLLVVVGVSAGFWTGVGFLVAHLVR